MHEGSVAVEFPGADVELGKGDVFTSPINAVRRIRNSADAPADIYVVLGSDAPTAERAQGPSESHLNQGERR